MIKQSLHGKIFNLGGLDTVGLPNKVSLTNINKCIKASRALPQSASQPYVVVEAAVDFDVAPTAVTDTEANAHGNFWP